MRTGARGWKVAGFNIDNSGNPGQSWLAAYAYCKTPGADDRRRVEDATVGASFLNSTVRCPDNGKALAGGFDGHISALGEQLTAAGALDSKRTADGHAWTTSSLSVSAPSLATITTYAYCRS